MSEADFLSLVAMDGANVLLPGMSGPSSDTDLVITGTGLVVTLAKAGLTDPNLAFGTSKSRFGSITFESQAVFTAGVAASPLTIVVS